MSNIKISIIVPVYNTSKFLEKCLRSIMKQDLKEIEIICVNDGSTDNSLEILEKLKLEDDRIIILNKKNGGLTTARNFGLNIAKGKYCLNIDSDDWVEQGYLKVLYERAEKDNLDITVSDIIFDYKENQNKNYILKDLNIKNNQIITGKEYINIFFKKNFYGYTWNKLIKTNLYKKNNILYNEKIFMLEDVEVITKLIYFSKKIGKCNKAFYHYVQHNNNGSKKILIKNFIDIEESFKSIIAFYCNKKEKDILLEIKKRKSILLLSHFKVSSTLDNNIEYRDIQNKYLNEIKNIPFFKIKEIKYEINKIWINILKIFPHIFIMHMLFRIDFIFIELLRKIKRKIKK